MNHQQGCFLPEDNRARKKVSAPINSPLGFRFKQDYSSISPVPHIW